MSSDDEYTTDDQSKKRRPTGKEIGAEFSKSIKILRTPPKPQRKEENMLDTILKTIQDMKVELTDEIRQVRIDQKKYAEEMEKLKSENEKLKKENVEIKKELWELRNTVERLDKEKRKNNIVLNGINIETEDNAERKELMKAFIQQHLGLNVQVREARSLGEKVCLISLESEQDKIQVMENKYKLKNNNDTRAVYLNNDLTKQEREIQRQMIKMAKEEKDKGNQVKKGYNKITINGVEWRWNKNKGKMEAKPKN